MRDAIRRLQPGAYEYAITSADRRADHHRVSRRGARRRALVDYAGSSPRAARITVVMNYTEAYTLRLKVIVSPEVPNTRGLPADPHLGSRRSILNARHPAPVAARHVIGHFLPHAVAGALKQALPGRVMAEGSANIWGIQIAGKDMDGRPFTYVFFTSGGTGARAIKDGLSATAFPSGVLGTPVEVIETLPHSSSRIRRCARARARRQGGLSRSGHRLGCIRGSLRVLGALLPHADRPAASSAASPARRARC